MTERTRPSGFLFALGALCAGAIVAAFLVVGPASQSATLQSRIVTAQQGVVQSTVSGSGNIQSATQLNLGFKTAGVVQRIYIASGTHVVPGQLLAELSPQSAEVTLEQARASLQAAEATLAQEEENEGETSAGSSSGSSSSSGRTSSSAAAPGTSTSPTASEKPKQSAATREANLASARASVKSEKLAVQGDEQAVSATKLYAPTSGTIVSLSGEVGETVTGTGTTRASNASSSSSSSSTSSARSTGGTSAAGGGAGAGSSTSSSSSSPFAALSDLSAMQLVVPLSESEVVHVHDGQPATVTIEALEGTKVAAHVVSVATLSTSNSGVVSYDVTFQLDQPAANVKPGMSAAAEVVVRQEEGVNVPTSAISGKAVTVVQGEKRIRRTVVTGLAGNSSTIILSGLSAGEKIALPIASTSSATSLSSRLGSRAGGGGLGGAALGGGGFPGGGPRAGGG